VPNANLQPTLGFDDTFKLRDQLGGGIGYTVWDAVHSATDQIVVVKIYEPAHLNFEYREFQRRAAAISAFCHPHVAQVLGYGRTNDGYPYWVMERLAGATLESFLAQNGPFSQERAISIAEQILDGLTAAHERSIVHGALRTSNVMLVESKQSQDFVKLIGFSAFNPSVTPVSNAMGNAHQPMSSTPGAASNPTLVSPLWTTSEALPYGAAGDVIAAGEILRQCVTGQPANTIGSSGEHAALLGPLKELLESVLTARDGRRARSAQEFWSSLRQVQGAGTQRPRTSSNHSNSGLSNNLGGHGFMNGTHRGRGLRRVLAELLLLIVSFCSVYWVGWWLANSSQSPVRRRHAVTVTASVNQRESSAVAAAALHPTTPAAALPSNVQTMAPVAPEAAAILRLKRSSAIASPAPSASGSGSIQVTTEPKDLADAVSDLQRARDLLAQGQVTSACAVGQIAASRKPNDPAAWAFLGRCYMRMGQPKQARAYYRRYLDLAPNSSNAVFVRAIVDKEDP
jgi:serine/threonine protein kinase